MFLNIFLLISLVIFIIILAILYLKKGKKEKKEKKEETIIQKELREETEKINRLTKDIEENQRETEMKINEKIEENDKSTILISNDIPEETKISDVKESFTDLEFEGGNGWWSDVVKCKSNGSNQLYCKKEDKWLFPY